MQNTNREILPTEGPLISSVTHQANNQPTKTKNKKAPGLQKKRIDTRTTRRRKFNPLITKLLCHAHYPSNCALTQFQFQNSFNLTVKR